MYVCKHTLMRLINPGTSEWIYINFLTLIYTLPNVKEANIYHKEFFLGELENLRKENSREGSIWEAHLHASALNLRSYYTTNQITLFPTEVTHEDRIFKTRFPVSFHQLQTFFYTQNSKAIVKLFVKLFSQAQSFLLSYKFEVSVTFSAHSDRCLFASSLQIPM